ncbi:hypothetical protein NCAS_0B01900 [Naumovozyma castellii]|uniref:Proteasome maturation factor UMP1 n=1 Tax=Naumovozyma castellii TaxID=27288 RepID=G0VBE8_NAUCA|nr:hypothetical protein NCAS_0B01900 [Naumovozyma castellii CBS 4309]CCC68274.1 hypothetical protein NCAS_0B01900 [Naumovozyma castellii CBS 4309]
MNVVPPSNFQSTVATDKNTEVTSIATHGALPDTLRQQQGGAVPLASQLNDRHPLQNRVTNWDQNEHKRQLEQYRQIFGIAAPMKREMELQIVDKTDFNPLSQGATASSIHHDILLNKDASIDWEDIYPETALNQSTMMVGMDVHSKIEKQLGI